MTHICTSAGPVWTRRARRRVDSTAEEEPEVFFASRGLEREEAKKTAGCMADGLRCNIWARAQFPAKLSYSWVVGTTSYRRSKRNGLTLQDLGWKPNSGGSKPACRVAHPPLDFLSHKIVHFLVDFYPSWFPALNLPPSNGNHVQLGEHHFHAVLERLETIHEVQSEVRFYPAVKLGHAGYAGGQTVHSAPFIRGHTKPRTVKFSSCGLNWVLWYVMFCTYNHLPWQDYVFFIPPPQFYHGRRSRFSPSMDECWYGRVVLLFTIHVCSNFVLILVAWKGANAQLWRLCGTVARGRHVPVGQAPLRLEQRCSVTL